MRRPLNPPLRSCVTAHSYAATVSFRRRNAGSLSNSVKVASARIAASLPSFPESLVNFITEAPVGITGSLLYIASKSIGGPVPIPDPTVPPPALRLEAFDVSTFSDFLAQRWSIAITYY